MNVGNVFSVFVFSCTCASDDRFIEGISMLHVHDDVLQGYRESEARNVDLLAACRQDNRCVHVSHCHHSSVYTVHGGPKIYNT